MKSPDRQAGVFHFLSFHSEWSRLLKVHTLSCNGMCQRQLLSVQVETIGSLSVELIAQDRAAKSVEVSAVHTQLVGTARVGIEGNAGMHL